MRLWRITDVLYAESAFSGAGAEKYGSRFNSAGNKVVYTAGSLSLAMLEVLVQANNRSRLRNHVFLWTEVSNSDILELPESELPEDWNALPCRSSTQRLGDDWLASRESLVLAVPSVIVPVERNYLINPEHPAFSSLEFSTPEPASFDPRLMT